MFVITVVNNGMKFWLKGTTWVYREERADVFHDVGSALEAAKKAERFMHHKIKKSYTVEKIVHPFDVDCDEFKGE